MLSQVPTQITHIDRNLDTLQFISVAINPSNPAEVQGGTQDNGTWSNNDPVGDQNNWPQNIYGDGGNSGYDGTNPTWRFNEFTSGVQRLELQERRPDQVGDHRRRRSSTAARLSASTGRRSRIRTRRPGRTRSSRGPSTSGARGLSGRALRAPFRRTRRRTSPIYEANCPEFTVFGAQPGCGDYQPLGGPQGSNNAGDLTGTVYGSDRTGGAVSWIARNKADHGTLWATTSAGRVFVTHNADASDPATVVLAPDRQRDLADEVPKLDLSGSATT